MNELYSATFWQEAGRIFRCDKSRVLRLCVKAMSGSLPRTEGGKVFRIVGAETWNAVERKLRLSHGTGSNKVAEERIDLVGL